MASEKQRPLKIAILGCGLMGTALLQGWLRNKDCTHNFVAYVRSESSRERLQRELASYEANDRVSYHIGDALTKAATEAEVIVLGFLPTDLQQVMNISGLSEALEGKDVVSLLAGVSLSDISREITTSPILISRVIPTLAAKIGASVTLVAEGSTDVPDTKDTRAVQDLFSLVGKTLSVPESLMNESTAIGAIVHALAIVAIDSITDASVAEGVPRATAQILAAQSLQSVCGLMLEGGMTPESVKQSMSTPGGITLNAVVNLDAASRAGIAAATRSAIQYMRQMGKK